MSPSPNGFSRDVPETAADPLAVFVALLAAALAPRVADLVASRLAEQTARDAPPLPTGLVDKTTAARAIGMSASSLDRLVRDGAPVHVMGTRRRFDATELRAWVEARGRKRTTPRPTTTPEPDDDEIADLALAAGLRRA